MCDLPVRWKGKQPSVDKRCDSGHTKTKALWEISWLRGLCCFLSESSQILEITQMTESKTHCSAHNSTPHRLPWGDCRGPSSIFFKNRSAVLQSLFGCLRKSVCACVRTHVGRKSHISLIFRISILYCSVLDVTFNVGFVCFFSEMIAVFFAYFAHVPSLFRKHFALWKKSN